MRPGPRDLFAEDADEEAHTTRKLTAGKITVTTSDKKVGPSLFNQVKEKIVFIGLYLSLLFT